MYRHYKGKLYRVLFEAIHSETREPMVVYVELYEPGDINVRPKALWADEVDMPEYNYHGPRFTWVGE